MGRKLFLWDRYLKDLSATWFSKQMILEFVFEELERFPANIYLFKINRNTRKRCELCSS